MVGIYKIENLINGKCYIGQSIDITRRWRQHRSDYKDGTVSLYQAIKKYGLNNFSFEIIEECSVDELDNREIYWIEYYNSYNNGYNETLGGSNRKAWLKINNEQLQEIISYLQNTNISQQEIATIFNVGEDTISEINQGRTRHQENVDYPIRKYSSSKYYCVDCGKEISYGAVRCHDCSAIHLQKVPRPSKEELYNDLLNDSFLAVGKKYGVSDNAVRKWCKRYGLPTKSSEYRSIR